MRLSARFGRQRDETDRRSHDRREQRERNTRRLEASALMDSGTSVPMTVWGCCDFGEVLKWLRTNLVQRFTVLQRGKTAARR